MRASEQAFALIKQCEGFSAMPYRCPAGIWTIGYGHAIKDGEVFPGGVDEDTADEILKRDVAASELAVNRLVEISLSQNQFDALVSFVYNIGAGNFAKSHLLIDVNQNDIDDAAVQFGHWVYADGAVLPGLVARRKAESALFCA